MLKLKNLITILFLFTVVVVSGQSFKGKLIAGLNSSQVDGDGLGGFDKVGLIGGGAVSFDLSENFYLQPEITYSRKGSRSTDKDFFYFRWRLNFVEVPIMFGYKILERYRIEAGPSFGFLTTSKIDAGAGFRDNKQAFDKMNIFYNAGVEYMITQRFSANLRFNYSAIPMNRNKNNITLFTVSNQRKYYSNVISVTVRYVLNAE